MNEQPASITKHGLDLIDISPQDYWWQYLRPDRDVYVPDENKIFEKAFRCAVLQPEVFKETYVRCPKLDKRNPHQKTEFLALETRCQFNNQILLEYDYKGISYYDKVVFMAKAVKEHPVANILFGSGSIGFPEIYVHPETGAYIEYTPHWISSNVIVNLMSTSDATEEAFQKEAFEKKLHKKAAIQMDGQNINTFIFVNVERTQPCKIGVRYLDEEAIALGRETYEKNCRTYVECLESGIWNGLPAKITSSSLPAWAFKDRE